MTKIVLGAILLLVATGTCLGAPLFALWRSGALEAVTEHAHDPHLLSNASDSTFTLEQTRTELLFVVTGGTHDGQRIDLDPADFPNGPLGFRPAAGGTLIPLQTSGETFTDFTGQAGDLRSHLLGYADLDAGSWQVVMPTSETPIWFYVVPLDLTSLVPSALIGLGSFVVFGIAGLVLVVAGLMGQRKQGAREAE